MTLLDFGVYRNVTTPDKGTICHIYAVLKDSFVSNDGPGTLVCGGESRETLVLTSMAKEVQISMKKLNSPSRDPIYFLIKYEGRFICNQSIWDSTLLHMFLTAYFVFCVLCVYKYIHLHAPSIHLYICAHVLTPCWSCGLIIMCPYYYKPLFSILDCKCKFVEGHSKETHERCSKHDDTNYNWGLLFALFHSVSSLTCTILILLSWLHPLVFAFWFAPFQ